ncbi:MAG: hypothetical protein HC833_23970 [Leptolyngbyaceae cyanobacterium RM1_406_9]|nr:hypothetical protein [Leptolyngbyaceae cyanobacterium RM1_406_9]
MQCLPFIDKWRLVSLNGLVKTINRPPAWKTEGRSHTHQPELEVSHYDISTATDFVESLLSPQCDRRSNSH